MDVEYWKQMSFYILSKTTLNNTFRMCNSCGCSELIATEKLHKISSLLRNRQDLWTNEGIKLFKIVRNYTNELKSWGLFLFVMDVSLLCHSGELLTLSWSSERKRNSGELYSQVDFSADAYRRAGKCGNTPICVICRLNTSECFTLGDVTTINMTMVKGGVAYNVVPAEMDVSFDLRIPPTVNLPVCIWTGA